MDKNIGWSFCIVTAPGNEEILKQCIEKIHNEFKAIDNYEIVIVGNPDLKNEILNKTTLVPFKEEFFAPNLTKHSIVRFLRTKNIKNFFYKTGAICHKKNLAAKKARYDKLCMMHDYVGLEVGWREGFEKFGDEWEIAMNIILNKDDSRHRDWMAWDHPDVAKGQKGGVGACLIPYDKYTKYMYISGTYFCVKRDFFLENPLDEKLFWGEGEDVEWSMRVRQKTQFKMNINSVVKYLKLKPLDGAPYCDSWENNRKKMEEVLKV